MITEANENVPEGWCATGGWPAMSLTFTQYNLNTAKSQTLTCLWHEVTPDRPYDLTGVKPGQ